MLLVSPNGMLGSAKEAKDAEPPIHVLYFLRPIKMDLQQSKILDFLCSNFSMDLVTKLILVLYYPQ